MAKTIDDKQKALADALHAAGHSRFSDKCYSSKAIDAQKNLDGKTHYVDASTMRYFKSRISYAGDHFHGLIYAIVESVSLDPDHKSRGFRVVVFDTFGTVLDRANLDECVSSSETARKRMYEFLSGLDVMAHYRTAIASQVKRVQCELSEIKACRRLAK